MSEFQTLITLRDSIRKFKHKPKVVHQSLDCLEVVSDSINAKGWEQSGMFEELLDLISYDTYSIRVCGLLHSIIGEFYLVLSWEDLYSILIENISAWKLLIDEGHSKILIAMLELLQTMIFEIDDVCLSCPEKVLLNLLKSCHANEDIVCLVFGCFLPLTKHSDFLTWMATSGAIREILNVLSKQLGNILKFSTSIMQLGLQIFEEISVNEECRCFYGENGGMKMTVSFIKEFIKHSVEFEKLQKERKELEIVASSNRNGKRILTPRLQNSKKFKPGMMSKPSTNLKDSSNSPTPLIAAINKLESENPSLNTETSQSERILEFGKVAGQSLESLVETCVIALASLKGMCRSGDMNQCLFGPLGGFRLLRRLVACSATEPTIIKSVFDLIPELLKENIPNVNGLLDSNFISALRVPLLQEPIDHQIMTEVCNFIQYLCVMRADFQDAIGSSQVLVALLPQTLKLYRVPELFGEVCSTLRAILLRNDDNMDIVSSWEGMTTLSRMMGGDWFDEQADVVYPSEIRSPKRPKTRSDFKPRNHDSGGVKHIVPQTYQDEIHSNNDTNSTDDETNSQIIENLLTIEDQNSDRTNTDQTNEVFGEDENMDRLFDEALRVLEDATESFDDDNEDDKGDNNDNKEISIEPSSFDVSPLTLQTTTRRLSQDSENLLAIISGKHHQHLKKDKDPIGKGSSIPSGEVSSKKNVRRLAKQELICTNSADWFRQSPKAPMKPLRLSDIDEQTMVPYDKHQNPQTPNGTVIPRSARDSLKLFFSSLDKDNEACSIKDLKGDLADKQAALRDLKLHNAMLEETLKNELQRPSFNQGLEIRNNHYESQISQLENEIRFKEKQSFELLNLVDKQQRVLREQNKKMRMKDSELEKYLQPKEV